jgi:hypothetical protein
MATCDCGRLWMDCGENCGCGCICVENGDCYSFCEYCEVRVRQSPTKIDVGLSAFVTTGRDFRRVDRSSKVTINVQGMSMGALVLALDRITHGQLLVPVGKFGEAVTLTKSGPLEEILRDLSIQMAE